MVMVLNNPLQISKKMFPPPYNITKQKGALIVS